MIAYGQYRHAGRFQVLCPHDAPIEQYCPLCAAHRAHLASSGFWSAIGVALVASSLGYFLAHVYVAWICGSFAAAGSAFQAVTR